MILQVLTTQRQIRSFAQKGPDRLLPKLLTISEFLDRAILPPKPFVGEELRKVYFHQACRDLPLHTLGIPKEFEKFAKEGELIYSFLKELFLERVELEDIIKADLYAQFEEHMRLIAQIRQNYKELLAKKGWSDLIVLDEYRINQDYFEQFEKIHIDLAGYLTAFDREVIAQIRRPIQIDVVVDDFNLELAKKMFGIQKRGYYKVRPALVGWEWQKEPLPKNKANVDIRFFDRRISQADFVFAKIEEFVQKGIKPENITVILPQADFKEYLEVFDEFNNLNFAMGESFVYSPLYRKLEALYRVRFLGDGSFLAKIDEELLERFERIEDFKELQELVMELASDKEKGLIEEDLFVLGRMSEVEAMDIRTIAKLLLDRLAKKSFDDVRGGKVTVMEVLESRGVESEGVIIVDFNEGVVPRLTSEDLFLDTRLRRFAALPTTAQKEGLQKHYYYQLLSSAKEVAISYVQDEQKELSRFLQQLYPDIQPKSGDYYTQVLYRFKEEATPATPSGFLPRPQKLSPTSLETLLRCPYRYYLRSIAKIEAPPQSFLGSKIHSAITHAIKAQPKDAKEYHRLVMEYLLQEASVQERYRILVEWDGRLRRFCQKDFELLDGEIGHEVTRSIPFGDIVLQARADRVIQKDGKTYIYDYKTSSAPDYLKAYEKEESKLQAEFYALLWQSDEVYFWDLTNTLLQKVPVDGAKEKLAKALSNLPREVSRCEDMAYCRFCEYRFGCRGLV